jgi:hypothetical protein
MCDESSDGVPNGHRIITEYRYDSAFVLPVSLPLSRLACVDEWLAQSPRVAESTVFDVEAFWAAEASPKTHSFGSSDCFGWAESPRASCDDVWRF